MPMIQKHDLTVLDKNSMLWLCGAQFAPERERAPMAREAPSHEQIGNLVARRGKASIIL